MVNAWELMLKAKILQDSKNKVSSIAGKEARKLKSGRNSKKLYIKRNRAGNPVTLSIGAALHKLRNIDPENITESLVANLLLLIEIRDNAIHLMNHSLGLEVRLQEVGTACVRNYLEVVQRRFNHDMTQYKFYLMPLSFFNEADVIESFSIQEESLQIRNLFSYLK